LFFFVNQISKRPPKNNAGTITKLFGSNKNVANVSIIFTIIIAISMADLFVDLLAAYSMFIHSTQG
jgi:hypothetical protein